MNIFLNINQQQNIYLHILISLLVHLQKLSYDLPGQPVSNKILALDFTPIICRYNPHVSDVNACISYIINIEQQVLGCSMATPASDTRRHMSPAILSWTCRQPMM